MKISVVSGILGDYSLDESLQYLSSLGVDEFELGRGRLSRKSACGRARFEQGQESARGTCRKHSKNTVWAFPRSPCTATAYIPIKTRPRKNSRRISRRRAFWQGSSGIDRLVTFSGCPGSDHDAKAPSWVTCAWPPDYPKALEWQWNEVLIPYWEKAVKFAAENGVKRMRFGDCTPGSASTIPRPACASATRSAA